MNIIKTNPNRKWVRAGVVPTVAAALGAFIGGYTANIIDKPESPRIEQRVASTQAEILADKILKHENVKWLNGVVSITLKGSDQGTSLFVQNPLVVENPRPVGTQKFDRNNFRFFTVTMGSDSLPQVTELHIDADDYISEDTSPNSGTIMEGTIEPEPLPDPNQVGRFAPFTRSYITGTVVGEPRSAQDTVQGTVQGKGGPTMVGAVSYDFGK